MEAIIIKGRGEALIHTTSLPKLREGYILVKVTAVAVNPSDWKHIDFMWVGDPTGARPGLEYAGVVIDIGPGVEKDFAKGDRVCGPLNGSNARQPEDGAFAEYLVAKAALQIKIPANMTDVEAAAIPTGICTVAQSLYQTLRLPLPGKAPSAPRQIPIFIYGGSTAAGIMAIQFAKLSGCYIVTTCSPHNFDYLTSLGADVCLDYHEPEAELIQKIKSLNGDKFRHALDCIATVESAQLCASVLSDRVSGHYCGLLYVNGTFLKRINPRITSSTVLGYTIMGEEIEKETVLEARPADFEYGKMFIAIAERLLHEDKFRPARQIVNEGGGGLEGVLYGLSYLRQGKVSAGKLVYTIP
ncbi:hypothetical protein PspLS_10423 [Pyricularia sp. CBS 133598]|nr:hypothetical protein PspLS_10423 [Pyricularia sp. CBS 133598]